MEHNYVTINHFRYSTTTTTKIIRIAASAASASTALATATIIKRLLFKLHCRKSDELRLNYHTFYEKPITYPQNGNRKNTLVAQTTDKSVAVANFSKQTDFIHTQKIQLLF